MASSDNHSIPSLNPLRIIPYHKYPGKMNMAIDHYFASANHSTFTTILRFYGWNPYCLSIGYHQKKSLIDINKIKRNGFDLVRRPTGGRAIFHAEELTYSIVSPKNNMDHRRLYKFVHGILAEALKMMGYQVELKSEREHYPQLKQIADDFPCFTRSAETEVQFEGKKVIGSAQKIYHHSILQHGSILIGKEHERLTDYLLTEESMRNLIDKEISQKTIYLTAIDPSAISIEKLTTNIISQLEKLNHISLYFKNMTEDELTFAKKYVNQFELL